MIPFAYTREKQGECLVSQMEKLKKKFYSKPIRNDMTYDEIIRLAEFYGCKVSAGGKHPIKIIDMESRRVIPIPRHGKYVKEAYIIELRELFEEIEVREQ